MLCRCLSDNFVCQLGHTSAIVLEHLLSFHRPFSLIDYYSTCPTIPLFLMTASFSLSNHQHDPLFLNTLFSFKSTRTKNTRKNSKEFCPSILITRSNCCYNSYKWLQIVLSSLNFISTNLLHTFQLHYNCSFRLFSLLFFHCLLPSATFRFVFIHFTFLEVVLIWHRTSIDLARKFKILIDQESGKEPGKDSHTKQLTNLLVLLQIKQTNCLLQQQIKSNDSLFRRLF